MYTDAPSQFTSLMISPSHGTSKRIHIVSKFQPRYFLLPTGHGGSDPRCLGRRLCIAAVCAYRRIYVSSTRVKPFSCMCAKQYNI